MLSPRMMSALVFAGAQASTPLMKYQCLVLAPEMVASLTLFPVAMCEVVRLPGCPVMLLPDWPALKYRLTVIMVWWPTLKSMGSV